MVVLIAHRGGVGDIGLVDKGRRDLWGFFGSGFIGENTLEAIQGSLDAVSIVEVDVQQSKGGDLVIIHDVTLDRTTTGSGSVADVDYDEIDDYFTRNGGRVPLLKEVMDVVLPGKKILLDMKGKFDDDVLFRFFDSIYFQTFSDNILVQSFDKKLLMRLRYRYRDMHIILLAVSPGKNTLRFANAIHAYAVHVRSFPLLYGFFYWKSAIELYQKSGGRLGVWTVDQCSNIEYFEKKGVWSIISNVAHLR